MRWSCPMQRVVPIILLLLAMGVAAAAGPMPALMGKKCSGCHALPPGSGPDNGRFKPGAHVEHLALSCDRCHSTGFEADHVNGVITIKAEIEYQYGTKVPWPSAGSGSCGGLGYPFRPQGCHERMPDAKCFWVPGKNCQPPERH